MNPDEQKTPQETRSIGKALEHLSIAQDKLSAVVESIEKRLEPIMSHAEETPSPSDKTERAEMNCKIAEDIECGANRADSLAQRLVSTRGRIEI